MHSAQQHHPRTHRRGLTLIELMIVMVLVAGIASLTLMGISALGDADAQAEARKLGGKIHYIYNQAAMKNQTFQLIINLDTNSYRVDAMEGASLMDKEQLTGAVLDRQNEINEERAKRTDDEDHKFIDLTRSAFTDLLIEDTQLPEGLAFFGVMTSHHEDIQTEGIATINFFPSGFVEPSMIQLGVVPFEGEELNESSTYTLVIHPLTGRTFIKNGLLAPEDAFIQEEED